MEMLKNGQGSHISTTLVVFLMLPWSRKVGDAVVTLLCAKVRCSNPTKVDAQIDFNGTTTILDPSVNDQVYACQMMNKIFRKI